MIDPILAVEIDKLVKAHGFNWVLLALAEWAKDNGTDPTDPTDQGRITYRKLRLLHSEISERG